MKTIKNNRPRDDSKLNLCINGYQSAPWIEN